MTPDSPEMLDFPNNWDQLEEPDDPLVISSGRVTPDSDANEPLVLSLFAATWADIVAIVAVSTAALLALGALGHVASLAAFPWALALSLMWWLLSATATIVVRRGTPGMLAAGVILAEQVAPKRVPWILAVTLFQCMTLGLPAFLGAGRAPIRYVSGVALEHVD